MAVLGRVAVGRVRLQRRALLSELRRSESRAVRTARAGDPIRRPRALDPGRGCHVKPSPSRGRRGSYAARVGRSHANANGFLNEEGQCGHHAHRQLPVTNAVVTEQTLAHLLQRFIELICGYRWQRSQLVAIHDQNSSGVRVWRAWKKDHTVAITVLLDHKCRLPAIMLSDQSARVGKNLDALVQFLFGLGLVCGVARYESRYLSFNFFVEGTYERNAHQQPTCYPDRN